MIMKKQIIFLGMMLAAAFTLTNCAKEIEGPAQESETKGYPFEIVASAVDTKTVNDGMATKWAANDQINLFHAVCDGTDYKNDGAFKVKDVESGNFSGELCEPLDPQEEYDWYAFYPYKSQIENPKNTSGWAYIGNKKGITQNGGYGNTAHIASTNCPLYGVATDVPAADMPSIEMQHLSSVIAINVTNNSDEDLVITNATFTANEPIVGSFYIDFSAAPTYTPSEEQYVSNAATVNVNNGAALGNGDSGILYLVVKPFTAAKESKLYLSVNGYEKGLTMPKDITFAAGKIKTLNFNYDKVKEAGVEIGTISFATDAQRTSFSGDAQVWENDGITFTNTKASSTNAVVNNVDPVRLYKSSDIKIEAPGFITKIEFNSATGDYFGNLKNLLPNASVSGQIVTEVYDGSSTSVSYSLTTGQVRLNGITVTYSSAGENPDQPENPEPEVVTLSSIKVSDDAETEYTVGDAFVKPVVTATYSDSSTKEVTAEFSGYDMDAAGTYTVNVSYTEKEVTATDSYEIVVKAKEDAEIVAHTVTWNLAKNETSEATTAKIAWDSDGVSMVNSKGTAQSNANNYYPGVDNRTSTRFYSGNSLKISPKTGYAINSVVFTATTEGYANELKNSTWSNAFAIVSGTTVTINPEDGREDILASITGTCGFTKVVVDLVPSEGYVKPVVVLSSIALNGQTTNYTVGDTFSFTGTVTATYSNGATQTVTPTKVSTPDMTTAGDKEVTVTYTEEGVTATAKYTITVSAAAATKKYYKKVTTAPTDWSGTYLIVAGTSAANGTITSKWLKYNSVTISNNQIESTAAVDAIAVTIKKESNGNYSIRFANGKYLGTTTSNDGIKVDTIVGTGFYWKFSVASSLVKIESTVQSSRILRLNGTSGFRTYTSSTGTQATLYKLQD